MKLAYSVILASASPRRRELLKRLVAVFDVEPADVDESSLSSEDPYSTAQTVARAKALAVFDRFPEHLVIAGDTVVAIPDADGFLILGKPKDARDAERMLGLLSGKEHYVITGVALRWPKGFAAFTDESRVAFRKLSSDEIGRYVASGEPMDKAGAYAIQGGARKFVERLVGSETNVVGLPIERLAEALRSVK